MTEKGTGRTMEGQAIKLRDGKAYHFAQLGFDDGVELVSVFSDAAQKKVPELLRELAKFARISLALNYGEQEAERIRQLLPASLASGNACQKAISAMLGDDIAEEPDSAAADT